MTLRTIFITAAIASVAVLGTIGSASAGGGGKTTFERYKPHVNVGTIGKGKGRAITSDYLSGSAVIMEQNRPITFSFNSPVDQTKAGTGAIRLRP